MTDGATSHVSPQLAKWQAIASILSYIAVPIVLGVGGYYVQKQLAEQGLNKDYVSIASGVLSAGKENQDPDLKAWAIEVLAKYSPVPFSAQAKNSLAEGAFFFPVSVPPLPGVARQPALGDQCDPSCLSVVTEQMDRWTESISRDDSVDTLVSTLSEAVDAANAYAGTADRYRVSGEACERIYDAVRGNPSPNDSLSR